ncbi:putative uncharacterized protein [Clostridium sp. CAG:1013]|nr:putative uncharacterized protein [Clostridium sp. CAG:1013]
MKKSSIWLCLLFMGLWLLSGCSGQERSTVADELPSTLTISAQMPEEYPQTVTKYQVDWCNVEEETAKNILMRNEATQREEWAQGPMLRAEGDGVDETLMLLQTVTPGGLIYHWETAETARIFDDCDKLRKHRPYEYTGDSLSQSLGNLEMEEYPAEEDLSFLPYTEAKSQLEKTMAACGMPSLEIYFSECHTQDLMNKNLEIYNNALTLPENAWIDTGEPIELFTTAEEHYYFAYRQVQDGIPFTSAIWPRSVRSEATETVVTALVSEDGLIELKANGLYTIGEALGSCTLISPQEAVNVYVEEYTQAIHFENTCISGVELNYVVVKDGESYIARPAWMLTLETDKTTEETSEQAAYDYVEFQTLAVSADTGIILERETDTR